MCAGCQRHVVLGHDQLRIEGGQGGQAAEELGGAAGGVESRRWIRTVRRLPPEVRGYVFPTFVPVAMRKAVFFTRPGRCPPRTSGR